MTDVFVSARSRSRRPSNADRPSDKAVWRGALASCDTSLADAPDVVARAGTLQRQVGCSCRADGLQTGPGAIPEGAGQRSQQRERHRALRPRYLPMTGILLTPSAPAITKPWVS